MTEITATRSHMYGRHWRMGYHFRGPADHADAVLKRYLRMIRWTCFDGHKHAVFVGNMARRLYQKHGCGMCKCKHDTIMTAFGQCWVDGHFKHLDRDEFKRVKTLYDLSQKVAKLEGKMRRMHAG